MNRLVSGLLIYLIALPALVSPTSAVSHQTLLLVAFRPFVGREANVGEDIVNLLDGEIITAEGNQLMIRSVVMPVQWGLPEPRIKRAIKTIQRDGQTVVGILILGERDGARVRVDRGTKNQRGMNLIDFGHGGSKTPGQRHLDEKIVEGDPLSSPYTSTLFSTIRDGLTRTGIAFEIGDDAGRYVCGEALYVSGELSPAAGILHFPGYPVMLDNKEQPENAAHLKKMKEVVVTVIEEIAMKDAS